MPIFSRGDAHSSAHTSVKRVLTAAFWDEAGKEGRRSEEEDT